MTKIFIMTPAGQQLEEHSVKYAQKYMIIRGRLLKRDDQAKRSNEFVERSYTEVC